MNKKRVLSIFSAAALTLGCCFAVGCDSDQMTPTADATVTEAEWQAAFNALESEEKLSAEIVYTHSETPTQSTLLRMVNATVAKDGYTTYSRFAYTSSNYDSEEYYTFEEASLVATKYYRAGEASNWSKTVSSYSSVEEYDTFYHDYDAVKRYLNATGNFRTSATGADITMSELYSHFTYDASVGGYTATVYHKTTFDLVTGKHNYEPFDRVFYFEDGILRKSVTVTTSNGVETVATATITYGETVTVPQEVLDATQDAE